MSEHKDNRPGAVVLLPVHGGKYLFQRNAKDDKLNPGKLRPPGGHSDKSDKDEVATIIRELSEEFDLDVEASDLKYLGRDTRGTSGDPHVFLLKDHALTHGLYQAANSPSEKIKLETAGMSDDDYAGPQLDDIMQSKSAQVAPSGYNPTKPTFPTYGDQSNPFKPAPNRFKLPEQPTFTALSSTKEPTKYTATADTTKAGWRPVPGKHQLYFHPESNRYFDPNTRSMHAVGRADPSGKQSPSWESAGSWSSATPGAYDEAYDHFNSTYLPSIYGQPNQPTTVPGGSIPPASATANGGAAAYGPDVPPLPPAEPGNTRVTNPTPNPAWPSSGLNASKGYVAPREDWDRQIAQNLAGAGGDSNEYMGVAKNIANMDTLNMRNDMAAIKATQDSRAQALRTAPPPESPLTAVGPNVNVGGKAVTEPHVAAPAPLQIPPLTKGASSSKHLPTMRPAHIFLKHAIPGPLPAPAGAIPPVIGETPKASPKFTEADLGVYAPKGNSWLSKNKGKLGIAGSIAALGTGLGTGYLGGAYTSAGTKRQMFSNGAATAAKVIDDNQPSFWETIWNALKKLFASKEDLAKNNYSALTAKHLADNKMPAGVAEIPEVKGSSIRMEKPASLMIYAVGLTRR